MPGLLLGVLDQSPIAAGQSGGDALRNTVDLARRCERLGYGRYWLAEHHGTPMLAGASPEVVIPVVAAATERMRVGSGGIMLPHYSPLKVAETFSLLSGLFPGRIDLGLGRAAGTDPTTTYALQRDRRTAAPDDFPEQLAELLAYLEGTLPAGHPFARLSALPGGPERPVPWLLGSSPQSAIWAGQLGLRYAFADFINPDGAGIAALYRERFEPSDGLAEPCLAIATSVVCAESDAEAQRLASSMQMAISLLRQGRLIAVPPVEEALRYVEQRGAPAGVPGRRAVIGAPATVRAGIEAVAAEYGAGEVLAVTITYEHAARVRSYELLAGAFASPTA